MKFQVDNIKVKSRTATMDNFNLVQRFFIWLLSIPVEKYYYVDLILTTYRENYLQPNNNIGLANGLNLGYRVLSGNINSTVVVITPMKPVTMVQIQCIKLTREGYIVYVPLIEKNFERVRYE